MDIRQVSPEEKRRYIDRTKQIFDDLRNVLNTLEMDMESEDLMTQASSVWIAGNMCNWYQDFMTQVKNIEKDVHKIKNEIKEVVEDNPTIQ